MVGWAATNRIRRICAGQPAPAYSVGQAAENGNLSVAVSLGSTEPDQAQRWPRAPLGSYSYAPISSNTEERPVSVTAVTVVHEARGRLGEVASDAQIVAKAVAVAREWVNIPANLLYPESFAAEVRQLVRSTRVGIDVLDEAALTRGGYGGMLAVGGGSSRPPRLVRLAYRPRGANFHLALVGKGITFATGGLNLKPAEGMYTMKCDMAGRGGTGRHLAIASSA